MKKHKILNRYISASLVLGLILPLTMTVPKLGEVTISAEEAQETEQGEQSEQKREQEQVEPVEKSSAESEGSSDPDTEAKAEELEAPENDDAVITKSASLGKMSQEEAGKDMELIAENDAAALFYSSKNSLVRLYNKKKELVFDNKVLDGQKGNRLTKNLQKSDFQLTFLKELRTLGVQSENNNEMSIELEQFEFGKVENGLKVTFTLGKQGLSADDLPVAIPSEKMAKVLKKLKKKERKQLLRLYREFKDRYTRKDDQTLSALQLKLYYGLLYDKGGYTKEDLEADNAQYASGEEAKSSSLKIELSMEYLLDGEDLLVKVPLSKIKINPETYLPYRLRLLPYAMIASELDDGYFLVPDGNGAIVKFNNDRKESANYSKRMYGEDLLYDKEKKRKENDLKFPVFAMRRDNQGVMLILEDGKDLADVTVEISGKSDEFNKLGIDYRLIDVDQVKTVGSSSVTQNKYPERLYTGDIVQRYRILDDKEANWLEMARIYSDYLEKKGSLPQVSNKDKKDNIDNKDNKGGKKPFQVSPINTNLSFFGIVPKKKFLLGVPYMSNQVMTSYNEASEILRDLDNEIKKSGDLNSDMLRLSATYLAEADSGLFPDRKKANLISEKMGSKAQRTELKNLVESLGGTLTSSIVANEVSSLKGFKKASEISRSLSGEYGRANIYDAIHQSSKNRHESPWFISPRFLPDYLSDLINRLGGEADDSLSLLGLGEMLVPDYKRDETVLRHEAMDIEHNLISELIAEDENRQLYLSNPADYALVASDNLNIKDITCEADPYRVFNYNVPFVSSIYRDRLNVELESFDPNSFMSLKKYLLYSLETGAVPNFLLTYENALTLENGDYEGLLGSQYSLRKDDILTAIKVRNEYLTKVNNSSLLNEKIYADGILRSLEFSNGQILWLNFSESDLSLADKRIEALGYLFMDKSDSEKVLEAAESLEKKHQKEEKEKDRAEEEAKEASAEAKSDSGEKGEENTEKSANNTEKKDAEKSDEKSTKKSDEKSSEKSEKETETNPEAKSNAKSNAKSDNKTEKKSESKTSSMNQKEKESQTSADKNSEKSRKDVSRK